MKSPSHPNGNTFWFGFAIGTFGAAAFAYLIGTKKGREMMKKVIEYAETYGTDSHEFLDLIRSISSHLGMANEPAAAEMEAHPPHTATAPPVSSNPASTSTLDTIIDKMKEMTSQSRQAKKFFVKNDQQ